MIEIWRDIIGYEGLYQVSNWGRVKRLAGKGCRQERILRPVQIKNGYLHVNLYKNAEKKTCSVHRLIATAFIPNPQNLPIVNHKDEVKTNNFVFIKEDGSVDFNKSNLEWCDDGYSVRYGTRTERATKANTNGKCSKPVYQKTLDGKLMREWPSLMEVERQTGWDNSNISACCLGKRKSAYRFRWSYTKHSL
jgi:hypothetical protein